MAVLALEARWSNAGMVWAFLRRHWISKAPSGGPWRAKILVFDIYCLKIERVRMIKILYKAKCDKCVTSVESTGAAEGAKPPKASIKERFKQSE